MGNCLDKTLSDDSADENIIEDDITSQESSNNQAEVSQSTNIQQSRSIGNISNNSSNSSNSGSSSNRRRHRHHRSHRHGNRSSRYIQIIESSLPIRSSSSNNNNTRQYSQSFVNTGYSSTSFSSSPLNLSNSLGSSSSQQVYYLTPNVQRTADQLTEEDQIKLLKRMALIQQLPSGSYDENKKNKECVICMIDFEVNDTIKYLPCMHTFHQSCIDTWLLRSLICPSCMEPVDAGLLAAYE